MTSDIVKQRETEEINLFCDNMGATKREREGLLYSHFGMFNLTKSLWKECKEWHFYYKNKKVITFSISECNKKVKANRHYQITN